MTCCHCEGANRFFSSRTAVREMRRYARKGPSGSTVLLVEALLSEGVSGRTLLDIGGGIGAVQHALASHGSGQITAVDASAGYLEVAREEAVRTGYADRVEYRHGDFMDLSEALPSSDVVTLDRVICCYPDMPSLVRASASHARHLYGVVFPRGGWLLRRILGLLNLTFWLRRNPFRVFAHRPEDIARCIREEGLEPVFSRRTPLWQVQLYARSR